MEKQSHRIKNKQVTGHNPQDCTALQTVFHWHLSSWTWYKCCWRQQLWNKFLVFGKTVFHVFDFASWLSSYNIDVHRNWLFHYNPCFWWLLCIFMFCFSLLELKRICGWSLLIYLDFYEVFKKKSLIFFLFCFCLVFFFPCFWPLWFSYCLS